MAYLFFRNKFRFPYLLLGCVAILGFSCTDPENSNRISDHSHEIVGLASPVILNNDTTVVLTADYFMDGDKIDSLSGSPLLTIHLSPDKKEIEIYPVDRELPILSELKVWISGYAYSLLLKRSKKIRKTIRLTDKKGVYSKVQLAGEMNNWNPESGYMVKKDGFWEKVLQLNPGSYQYQLVTDGKWILDPGNPEKADNNIGGINSVLTIRNFQGAEIKLYTRSFLDGCITIGSVGEVEEIFAFWQNSRIDPQQFQKKGNSFTIEVPEEAKGYWRSHFRIWAMNTEGVSNDLLIPLEHGKVITSTAQLDRNDKEASIMYFILVDRFCNGDLANDHPVADADVAPRANYFGGDLAGVSKKIMDGYFSNLGINTLWLSPIVQNPLEAYVEYPAPHRKFSGYHGYWPISSTTVDHRFGNPIVLRELVGRAHSDTMNILMDFVANHVHEKHPLYVAHPEWATHLYLADSSLNIRLWDAHRLTTWFDTFLPSLDFSNPEVVESQTDSALFWLDTYGLDGFRHDATKHIPEVFWRTLTRKIKERYADRKDERFYQIGETFGSRELIGSYVCSGQLDAQFDFNLYFDARSAFAVDNASFEKLDNSLKESFSYYGNHHLMGNITGNHDLPRFISYASEAISFTEDAKEAGWKRDVEIKNPVGYDKLVSLTAFILTIPGVPIIYYGDEIGMVGAGDPDNRRPMKFDNLTKNEQETKSRITQLIKLRKSRMSLIYGDFETIRADSTLYIYTRSYFGETTIVVFNKSNTVRDISFDLPDRLSDNNYAAFFGTDIKKEKGKITLKLPPFSFEMMKND